MKANIHPTWYHDCAVTCSCGNTFVTGSNAPTLQIDICNKCHPFFTGEVKFVDRQGRVDRFNKKVAAAQAKVQKSKKKTTSSQDESKSYREILRDQQSELRTQEKAADKKSTSKADKAEAKAESK